MVVLLFFKGYFTMLDQTIPQYPSFLSLQRSNDFFLNKHAEKSSASAAMIQTVGIFLYVFTLADVATEDGQNIWQSCLDGEMQKNLPKYPTQVKSAASHWKAYGKCSAERCVSIKVTHYVQIYAWGSGTAHSQPGGGGSATTWSLTSLRITCTGIQQITELR